jgi:hypothetical protein
MVLLVLCCGLLLTGCPDNGASDSDGDGEDRAEFTFTVNLHAQGITGQTAAAVPLAQPLVPLTGATVTLQ